MAFLDKLDYEIYVLEKGKSKLGLKERIMLNMLIYKLKKTVDKDPDTSYLKAKKLINHLFDRKKLDLHTRPDKASQQALKNLLYWYTEFISNNNVEQSRELQNLDRLLLTDISLLTDDSLFTEN